MPDLIAFTDPMPLLQRARELLEPIAETGSREEAACYSIGEAEDMLNPLPADAVAKAPYVFGLTTAELLTHVDRELTRVACAVNLADSLSSVAGLALRHQDTDADGDVADVLQNGVYPQLEEARDAVKRAEAMVLRIRELIADTGAARAPDLRSA